MKTLTRQGASRIYAAYNATDRHLFNIPCPHCGALHVITRDIIHWNKHPDGTPDFESVRIICPHCNTPYDDNQKNTAIADPRAAWIPSHHHHEHWRNRSRGESISTRV